MMTYLFAELTAGSGIIVYLLLIGAMLYFFLWRPQKKQMAQRQDMLNSLRVGDRVSTIGGILGEVRALRDNEVYIQVADGLILEFQRQAVSGVIQDEAPVTEEALDEEPTEEVGEEAQVVEQEVTEEAVDPDFACIKDDK